MCTSSTHLRHNTGEYEFFTVPLERYPRPYYIATHLMAMKDQILRAIDVYRNRLPKEESDGFQMPFTEIGKKINTISLDYFPLKIRNYDRDVIKEDDLAMKQTEDGDRDSSTRCVLDGSIFFVDESTVTKEMLLDDLRIAAHPVYVVTSNNPVGLKQHLMEKVRVWTGGIKEAEFIIIASETLTPLKESTQNPAVMSGKDNLASDKSKVDYSEKDSAGSDQTNADQTEIDHTAIDQSEANQDDIDQTEIDNTSINKIKANDDKKEDGDRDKSKIDQVELDNTGTDQSNTGHAAIYHTATDQSEANQVDLDQNQIDQTKIDNTSINLNKANQAEKGGRDIDHIKADQAKVDNTSKHQSKSNQAESESRDAVQSKADQTERDSIDNDQTNQIVTALTNQLENNLMDILNEIINAATCIRNAVANGIGDKIDSAIERVIFVVESLMGMSSTSRGKAIADKAKERRDSISKLQKDILGIPHIVGCGTFFGTLYVHFMSNIKNVEYHQEKPLDHEKVKHMANENSEATTNDTAERQSNEEIEATVNENVLRMSDEENEANANKKVARISNEEANATKNENAVRISNEEVEPTIKEQAEDMKNGQAQLVVKKQTEPMDNKQVGELEIAGVKEVVNEHTEPFDNEDTKNGEQVDKKRAEENEIRTKVENVLKLHRCDYKFNVEEIDLFHNTIGKLRVVG